MRRLPIIILVGVLFSMPSQAQQLSFDNADTDNDGRVSREEYRVARELQFKAFDTNGDGVVTSNDFVNNSTRRTALDKIDELIAVFDVDGNGVVSSADVRVGPLPLFDAADADRDGSLTEPEMAALRDIVAEGRRASR